VWGQILIVSDRLRCFCGEEHGVEVISWWKCVCHDLW
jgi:hypothetical protein